MTFRFSPELEKSLKKLKLQDPQIFTLINKQLNLFKVDPKHPSLRIHKLSGKMGKRWSISINKSLRIVYVLLDYDVAYLVAIGTHDKVYRQN